MVIHGDLRQARGEVLDAIDELAKLLTGSDREH